MAEAINTREPRSQVRVQLTTRHPDISLPDNPGPILVNTGKIVLRKNIIEYRADYCRFSTLCSLHARQYSTKI